MIFMASIIYDPTAPTLPSDPPTLQPEHAVLERELRERGIYRGGGGLYPVEHGKRIRTKGGRKVVTDGPFAETKEALGGFYVLECGSMDEAVELASRIPVDSRSWVEVRPLGLYHPA
jgi:hypothetical protein